MKHVSKETKKPVKKKAKKKSEPKLKKPAVEKIEDAQKLVHLLQVHQIELEHQNEELRITQEELEVSRNKYVNLFDFSPIPYFTLDRDGIIKEVNLSASKMFGVDRKKIIGKNFITFLPLAEREIFKSFIKIIFDSSVKNSCELKMVNKNKNVFHVLLEAIKLDETLDSDNNCQVALIDLTEYKRIENSLMVSNEKLKSINDTKDRFFSIIAHDLRSPFQSLLNCSELLATEIETLSSEEIATFSKGLNTNMINLYSLLENLLHWSMMQRNMLDYNPVNVNLYEFVNKIIGISNQSAVAKNISIANNVNSGTVVYGDVDMLRSIIQNLLTNAIKFTPTDGRIIISSTNKAGIVEISIQDTGIGIEAEKIPKLFNFSTLSSSKGTGGENGTGLGLPLCKEFVEKHGGKIWVESVPGNLSSDKHDKAGGSKFSFTLRRMI